MDEDGWKIQGPTRMCMCRTCVQNLARVEASKRTQDLCTLLAQQAVCTGEMCSVTDPDGTTLVFRPLFVVAPGAAWDTNGDDFGYCTYAVRDSAPEHEPLLADLLDLGLDVAPGAN